MKTSILAFLFLSHLLACQSQDLNEGLYSRFKNQPSYVILKNVNVIDMDSNRVVGKQDVVIKQGKISSVTASSDAIKLPGKPLVVDATGKFLMPGLTDCHAHFYDVSDLWLFLAQGVTALRVMSGNETLLRTRAAIKQGRMIGPQMFVSSPVIDNSDFSEYNPLIDNADACNIVMECKAAGYDYIKIGDQLPPGMYKAIARRCRELEIKLVGHVPGTISVAELVASGQYSVEHLLSPHVNDDQTLASFARSGIWICPTLVVYAEEPVRKKDYSTHAQFKYIHASLLKEWARYPQVYVADKSQFKILRALWEQGARVVAGTDCRSEWVVPGFSLHQELQLMAEQGIPAFDVLKTATTSAAAFLQTGARGGKVKPGFDADLLLLTANPLLDVRNTRSIDAVVISGRWFGRPDLDFMMSELARDRGR